MIERKAFERYLKRKFGKGSIVKFAKLGSGVYGDAYLVKFKDSEMVLKGMETGSFGHDHFSDIAKIFIWQNDAFNKLERHVKAYDVVGFDEEKGEIVSLGTCKKFLILMERAHGRNYFEDLDRIIKKRTLAGKDITRIHALSDYLVKIHAVKHEDRSLYARKIRDTVGNGECIMGILDAYPELGYFGERRISRFVKMCVDEWIFLRKKYWRLSKVHGDFHPGNIIFSGGGRTFKLLDRSRGEFGEPADDVTALCINYIFYYYTSANRLFLDMLERFIERYEKGSKDVEIWRASPLFFAFRAIVVANPLFYPDGWFERRGGNAVEVRKRMLDFAETVLTKRNFDIELVD
ncbi:MAG: aminoglycoside phosphotransferase family protein [Candidatus Micrarchaeia archaeon]